jgi:hypothetical protein
MRPPEHLPSAGPLKALAPFAAVASWTDGRGKLMQTGLRGTPTPDTARTRIGPERQGAVLARCVKNADSAGAAATKHAKPDKRQTQDAEAGWLRDRRHGA